MARSQQCQLIQYRRRPMGTSDFAPSARWNPRKHFDRRPAEPMESIRVHGVEPTILSFWGYQQPTLQWKFTMWGGFPLIVKKTKGLKSHWSLLSVFSLSLGLPAPIFLRAAGHPWGPHPALETTGTWTWSQSRPRTGDSMSRNLGQVVFLCWRNLQESHVTTRGRVFLWKKTKKTSLGKVEIFFCDGCMSTKYPKP